MWIVADNVYGKGAALNAVQIIDLVEFGGSQFEEEDGYVHETTENSIKFVFRPECQITPPLFFYCVG